MNTVQDLREEFDRLAAQAPDGVAVRAAVERQAALAAWRRRTLSLVAVVASVVVVIGGAAAAVSVLGDRGAGTAAVDAAGSGSASGDGGAMRGDDAENESDVAGQATSSASATSGASATSSAAPRTSGQATALEPPAAAATAMTLARGPNSSPAPPETIVAGALNDPDMAAVSWGVAQSDRTAVLSFALSNVTDEDVWLKEITLAVPGMTQQSPAADDLIVIPARSSGTVVVQYSMDDCAVVGSHGVDPTVELLFFRDVWWAKPLTIDDDGFLRYVTQELCQ